MREPLHLYDKFWIKASVYWRFSLTASCTLFHPLDLDTYSTADLRWEGRDGPRSAMECNKNVLCATSIDRSALDNTKDEAQTRTLGLAKVCQNVAVVSWYVLGPSWNAVVWYKVHFMLVSYLLMIFDLERFKMISIHWSTPERQRHQHASSSLQLNRIRPGPKLDLLRLNADGRCSFFAIPSLLTAQPLREEILLKTCRERDSLSVSAGMSIGLSS